MAPYCVRDYDLYSKNVCPISSFTLEVNDTNSRPSISSSSGCMATVSDGLWATLGEAAIVFQDLPYWIVQRLLTFFLFLSRYRVDVPGFHMEEPDILDLDLGTFLKPEFALGVTMTMSSILGSPDGWFLWSTISPSACLPLIQGTYVALLPHGLDIIGFSTSLGSGASENGAEGSWLFELHKKKKIIDTKQIK